MDIFSRRELACFALAGIVAVVIAAYAITEMTLLQFHLFAATAWVAIIGAETVLELHGSSTASRQLISRVHKWIDISLEGPLIAAIAISGAVLLARAWPAPPLLLVKVGAGMIALVANAFCLAWVQARARTDDDAKAVALTKKIWFSGYAIPFGLIALVIGLLRAQL
jgi:phage-related minor tail protein